MRISCLSKKRDQPALRHRLTVLLNSARRTVAAVLHIRAAIVVMVQSRPQLNTLTEIRQAISGPINSLLHDQQTVFTIPLFLFPMSVT